MQKYSLKNTNDGTFRRFIETKQKNLRRSCTKENTGKSQKDISQFIREENIQCKNYDMFFQKKHQNIVKLSKTLQDMWQKQIDDIKILNIQITKEKLIVKKIKRQRNLMNQKKKNLNQTLQNYQEDKLKLQEDIKKYQLCLAKNQRQNQEIQLLFKKVQKIQHQLDLCEDISFNFVDQLQCLQQNIQKMSQNTQNSNLKKTIQQLQDLICEKSSNVFFNKLEKQMDYKYIEILSSKYQKLSFEQQEQNSQNLQSLYIQRNNKIEVNSNKYSDCIYTNQKMLQDESGDILPMIFMDQSQSNNQSTKINQQIINNIQSPLQNYHSSQTRKTIDKKLKRQLTEFGKHQQSAYFRNNSVNVQKKSTYSVLQQSNFADKKSLQEYQLLEVNWKKILKSFIYISSIVFENSDTLANVFLDRKLTQSKEQTLKFLNQTRKRQQKCKQYIEGYKNLKEVSIQGLNSCIKSLVSQLKTEKFYQNEFVQIMKSIDQQAA